MIPFPSAVIIWGNKWAPTPIGGCSWCRTDPTCYWRIQMTSEDILLVLVIIKTLRCAVSNTVQGCLLWYGYLLEALFKHMCHMMGNILVCSCDNKQLVLFGYLSCFGCLNRRHSSYFSSSYMAICCCRAAGRGGPTLPLLEPRAAEDVVSLIPCSPTLSLWLLREPLSVPESLV